MNPISRRAFCTMLACSALPVRAVGEAWPTKPVQILVPGGAGGVTDIRARWIAARLSAVIGQPVVVENRPGAGGLIGMEAGARAAPDGHTLVIVHQGTLAVNPHIYAKLPYDAVRDYAPITRLGTGPVAMVVNPSLGVRSVKELIALANSRPQPLAFGSPGVGTPPHIAAELFLREARIKATHVPYKGGGQAVSDLIGGHVDFSIEGLTVTDPHIKAGRLVALATTGRERVALMPDVPTVAEAALPGYRYEGWVGIAAPAATPKTIVEKAHAAIARVMDTEESRAWFAMAGADSVAITPEAFTAFIRDESERLGRLVRDAGIRVE